MKKVFGCLVALVLLAAGVAVAEEPLTMLDVCAREFSSQLYLPQAGDMLLFDTYKSRNLFFVATGSPISHAAIVVEKKGGLWVLSAEKGKGVVLEEFFTYLRRYCSPNNDVVWMRRPIQPISADQKARLAAWAEKQDGLPYAHLGQLLAVPYKVPVVDQVWGMIQPEKLEQPRWFCTQLTISAYQVMGLMSCQFRPSSFDPGELWRMHGFCRPYVLCGLTPD